eukprot:7328661-Pyramimonas_sp.AAC.1
MATRRHATANGRRIFVTVAVWRSSLSLGAIFEPANIHYFYKYRVTLKVQVYVQYVARDVGHVQVAPSSNTWRVI